MTQTTDQTTAQTDHANHTNFDCAICLEAEVGRKDKKKASVTVPGARTLDEAIYKHGKHTVLRVFLHGLKALALAELKRVATQATGIDFQQHFDTHFEPGADMAKKMKRIKLEEKLKALKD